MAQYQVPLRQGQPQQLSVTIASITYGLTFQYQNIDQGGWVLDIADSNGNPIVNGIPLVTGANLLEQYGYLGFTFGLYVQTTSDPDAVPTFDNLGADAQIYVVTA